MDYLTRLHRCIAESRTAVGMFFGLNSPALAELVVHGTEMDFVATELQHASIDTDHNAGMLRAIQAADREVTPMVRLPDHSVYWIQQSLDAGYLGLIAPLVESAEQASALVRAAYFPPLGDRSFAGSVRASMYRIEPNTANERMILLPQIESARGLEQIEQIVTVDGVTGVLFGPEDLSLSCGWRGKDLWSYAPFMEAVRRVVSVCHDLNKPAAILTGAYNEARDAGFDIIGCAGDAALVRTQMVESLNDRFRQLRQRSTGDGAVPNKGNSPKSDRQRLETYRGCLNRFDRWVDTHLQSGDRGWCHETSADGYFSLPSYAIGVGRRDLALRALRRVQEHYINNDGELNQGANRDQMITYVPSWYALSAFAVERYDLSASLLDFACTFQDPRSGGFFAGLDQRQTQSGPIDFDGTTLSIIALARAGRIEPSVKGAEFLLKLCKAQPAPDKQFCTAWSEPEGLLSEPGQVAATTILRWSESKQHYYKAGLLVLALVHVYGVTAKRRYLDAAVKIYQETIHRAADLWTNTLSHKMCWAGTALYAITGQTEYLQHACKFADHLVGLQQPDGAFTYPEFWETYPPEKWELIANIGPQFALWISRVTSSLQAEG